MPSQPWQLLAALSALQEEPANPLSWWYGGCGQAGMWAELSVEASSGSSCSGRGVPPWSGGVQQQQATVQLEAAGGIWKQQSQPSLPCMFEGLGLGEHCKLQGQGLTQDIDRLTINPVQGSWGC